MAFKKGTTPWNKGLNKETNQTLAEAAIKCSNAIKGRTGYKHTDADKQRLREQAIARELGGHTSKRQIHYEKADGSIVHLQSSYEVDLATNLDANNIKWIRPKYLSWEDKEGQIRRYYADFYLTDYDTYLDPKNDYLITKDEYKINQVQKQNNVKVLILTKNQLDWNIIKTLT